MCNAALENIINVIFMTIAGTTQTNMVAPDWLLQIIQSVAFRT